MHLLNPGLLGTRAAFGREFSLPIERDSDEEVAARLRALTAPFILRRTKRDPEIRKQLPAKIERTRPCPLSADQAALYQATVENMLKQIETADPLARRGLILKVITQLKQICNHPLNFAEDGGAIAGRSGKLAELERITADALACNEKTLCFTQYPSFAHRLAPYLRTRLGCGVEVFDGKLNDRARRALRHRFTDDVDLGLLLVSYGAGGTAVNLVAANHVVLYDRWWNPAVEDQAADRSYRIGQDKDVYVHRLLSAGTLEERIEALLERKRALADLVISSLAAEITALDNTALREMLSLSTRALSESWGDE
jgi:SNF2 family DNA or RNA helicase